MDLGIVIVNYNTRELLRRCLETVFASEGLSFHVCVVDNASEDSSVEMVARDFPQVLLIANQENVGYPTANNRDYGHWASARACAARFCMPCC
jgi:GT2 family glycosyltransferase